MIDQKVQEIKEHYRHVPIRASIDFMGYLTQELEKLVFLMQIDLNSYRIGLDLIGSFITTLSIDKAQNNVVFKVSYSNRSRSEVDQKDRGRARALYESTKTFFSTSKEEFLKSKFRFEGGTTDQRDVRSDFYYLIDKIELVLKEEFQGEYPEEYFNSHRKLNRE